MKRQWILGTLGVAVLTMVLIITGQHGAWAYEPEASAEGPARALAATLVVTSTADSGTGTLRWAMSSASDGETITFDTSVFPPTHPMTIGVTTQLPGLVGNVTIDASNAGVIVDGTGTPAGDDGFFITSDGNVIKGLQILHFGGDGVVIRGGAQNNVIGGDRQVGTGPTGEGNLISGNGHGVRIEGAGTMSNTVSGNYIGTDVSGTASVANTGNGILITDGPQYNHIGGDNEGERNLISGNDGNGVRIEGAGTMSNTVSGNYIGTDASGTAALPNGTGIGISGGASHNTIGGDTEARRNIISGNNGGGVSISGSGSSNNTVRGNFIGTDAAGIGRLPNGAGGKGIYVFDGATDNVIGGSSPNEGNLISGNDYAGIEINGPGTTGNVVQGNHIGTDVTGAVALGNREKGVFVCNGAQYNRIGGTMTGEGNVISGNDGTGVQIEGPDADHNVVAGNYIGTDADGTAAVGNVYDGVAIWDGRYNIIGGDTEGERNIITSNQGNGVSIWGSGAMSNTVSGNYIGVDLDGTVDLHAQALAISPGYATDATIFVGTEEHGVFKSINGGNSWVAVNIGLTASNIQALAISPSYATDQTIYAGAASGDIFKSTDGGGSWVAVNTGLAETSIRTLALSPDYGTDQTIFAGTSWGIFRSTDGGSNWSAMNSDLTNLDISALVISPDFAMDQTVFIGTWGGGVYKSTDMSLHWAAANNGLTTLQISALGISPNYTVDQTLFAGTWEGAVFKSTDGGGSWVSTDFFSDLTDVGAIGALAVSPNYATDQTIFVSTHGGTQYVSRSTDGGSTWTHVNSGLSNSEHIGALALSPNYATDETVFLSAFWNGVFKSGDGGGNWVPANNGLTELGNCGQGVHIGGGAQWNTIGGDTSGRRNVISNNSWAGVHISGAGTDHNMIIGNYIGTDVTGSTNLGNSWNGVGIVDGAQRNVIGGATMGERNVISGNYLFGVYLGGGGTVNNVVIGNFIGTDVTGSAALGNRRSGVGFSDWGGGAQQNRVGGTTEEERNIISGNRDDGVRIEGSDTMSNTVSGNYIGTDANGTAAIPNAGNGIQISGGASDNLVGGDTPGERNLISGNSAAGVLISQSGTTSNTVVGNFIGTDVSGSVALSNGEDGIRLDDGAQYNVIGGATAGERNLISGNGYKGVFMAGASHNVVIGNYVGTDSTGMAPIGNGSSGVEIYDGSWYNRVGGTTSGERNVISGNATYGVVLNGDFNGAEQNSITGNYIGTDATGAGPLGNASHGVGVWNGASNNLVGGNVSGERNVIAYNGEHGVAVYGPDSLRNTITQNSIHDNEGMGIDLGDGGNTELPAPAISNFDLGAGTVTGTACADCTVEVFSDDAEEGRTYEGTTTASGAGDFTFDKGAPFAGPRLTSTATDGAGNTSEFSIPTPITCVVTSTADSGAGTLRACLEGAVRGDPIEFDTAVFPPGDPATITLASGLPDLDDGNVTLDASNAGVILDGSGIGTTPETVLLDDVSLTLDGGPDLLSNGDFGTGLGHWRPWDDRPGATRAISTGDYRSSPNAYEWSSVAHASTGRAVYDTTDSSEPFEEWPYGEGSTVWIAATGGSAVEVHFWYRYGGVRAGLSALFTDGHVEWMGDEWFDWQADWTEAVVSRTLPDDAIGVALQFDYSHPESGTPGLWIPSSGNTIWGLQIVGFPGDGIRVEGGGQGNRIGGERGVGAGPLGQGNLVSGNGDNGVYVGDPETAYNTVEGNYIGVDTTGVQPLGNWRNGVRLWLATHHNDVLNNVISGNGSAGVEALNDDVGNVIQGNLIGLDVTGTAGLGNGWDGIYLGEGGWDNKAPRLTQILDNVISSNGGSGIEIQSSGAVSNTVSGNTIGTDASGTAAIPNTGNGISIHDGASDNLVGGSNASPGGACSGECNLLSGNDGSAIAISGNDTVSNVVSGNYIGTDRTGTVAIGNGTGIEIAFEAQENVVGGDTPGERNLISGNNSGGVLISGSGSSSNTVRGNFIGTDATGTRRLPNGTGGKGIFIFDGATDNVVGGSSPNEGNLISGNDYAGIEINGIGTTGNVVQGNYIGTDVTGAAALGNWGKGVFICDGAQYNRIGGTTTGEGNVISGNDGTGVQIEGLDANHNVVAGNYIGTDADGTAAVGNVYDGVAIWEGRYNVVGGNSPGERNVISGNGSSGISIRGSSAMSNTVSGNYIGTDASGAADLGNGGPGIQINGGAHHNTVGGNTTQDRNVISGNAGAGVLVTGEWIGLDVFPDLTGLTPDYVGTFPVIDFPLTDGAFASEDGIIPTTASGDPFYDIFAARFTGLLHVSASGTYTFTLGSDDGALLYVGGNLVIERNYLTGYSTSQATLNLTAGSHPIEIDFFENYGEAGLGLDVAGPATAILTTDGGAPGLTGELFQFESTLYPTSYNTVSGNYIGTDVSGSFAISNTGEGGVYLAEGAQYSTVGGDTPGERNLISGNRGHGVAISGEGTLGNTVSGNYIGTDASGTAALPNGVPTGDPWVLPDQGDGVFICCGASYNLVGGRGTGEGNVLSGNVRHGVLVWNAGADYNQVIGNLVGTDAAGESSVANDWLGVGVYSGPVHTVVEGNVIGGNRWGIGVGNDLEGDAPRYTHIKGNRVGTDAAGSGTLGNVLEGIFVGDGASDTVIGGPTVAERNTVAHNGGHGVSVYGAGSLRNTITRNSIHDNDGMGIDLGDGGNAGLAAPVITNVDLAGGVVTGTACANCAVEVFSDDADEGKVYEGRTTANGAGDWTFSKGAPLTGPYLTATATDGAGNTSEFSDPAPSLNTPPDISGLPDQLFDHVTSPPGTIDLWAYAYDEDTPTSALTYTIVGTPPAGAGVTLSGNRTVTVNPSKTWCGGTDVTVRVTDPGGLWDEDTFRVAVSWSCPGPVAMPGAPVLVAPVDGSAASNSAPAFAWHPVGGAESYRVQVDDDAGFSSPERDETTAGTEYRLPSGLSGGTYTWRVRAVKGSELGDWSEGWEFTVPTASPPQRKLYLPVVARDH